MEKILLHLKKSRNIRGDVRAHLNEEERARQNVQKNIERAKDHMRKKGLTKLVNHLTDYLFTGSPCIYRPPLESAPDWNF